MMTDSKGRTIAGYTYGMPDVPRSSVTVKDLVRLKISAGFTEEDEQALRRAGEILAGQTSRIVAHWRAGIIAGIPHLAAHSRSIEGDPLPEYLDRSNQRFEQWILDTCNRPYDQSWVDYQQEIAARHTTIKKNLTDAVKSTAYVPLRDIVAFTAVMNETLKPYLAAGGDSPTQVDRMHLAWWRSIQIQLALWARLYEEAGATQPQW